MKLIGITGVARSGKNLFSSVAKDILTKKGYDVKELSLAEELKKDLYDLIYSKTGISTYTEIDEEKELIRPLMIAHGNMMRKVTRGKHWTSLLEERIKSECNFVDFCFVTDVRFAEYPEDELYWVTEKMNGKLVHISRTVELDDGVSIIPAPNIHEMQNDPKMERASHYKLVWETVNSTDVNNVYIRQKVTEIIDQLI